MMTTLFCYLILKDSEKAKLQFLVQPEWSRYRAMLFHRIIQNEPSFGAFRGGSVENLFDFVAES
ncbi:unnamed protein product [Arabidopsis halleri]